MNTIAANLQEVRAQIASACGAAQRRCEEVTLLAVSKTFAAADVVQAVQAGQLAFGENYIQEVLDKMQAVAQALPEARLQWHCIGPIQSNKTRLVAEHFDWVHTIDRLKTAQRLSEQRPAHLPDLQVCVQVNVDGGANKSGVPLDDALALAQAVSQLPRLKLRGLMSIPEPSEDGAYTRAMHERAAQLLRRLQASGLALDTLSMGMSADLNEAIAACSTLVRVGTAIFGRRAKAAV
jgi:PLP dependent protein